MSTPATTPAPRFLGRRNHVRFRKLRLALLLTLLGLVLLAEPRVFQFVVRNGVAFEAWRCGGQAHISRVEGSIFDPVTLVSSVWTMRSRTGAVTRVEVDRLTAEFAWSNIFKRGTQRWFRRLSLLGVTSKIELPKEVQPPGKSESLPLINVSRLRARWLPAPSLIEGREVECQVACGDSFVWLQKAHFRFSEMEPGVVKAGRVIVQQPWLKKTFPNIRGTTKLDDSTIQIARIALDPGVGITSYSTDLAMLARGGLQQKIEISAFGGNITAEAKMVPGNQAATFSAGGDFSEIDIGKLATFLGLSEAAGGRIKNGNFSFRGSPANVAKSTTRLYVEATNFQWESRQWDSLKLGAELIDQRLQVHECVLHQGANDLTLEGWLNLPKSGKQWWQSDFDCNLVAKIDNFTDLSALLLPEFTFAAGKASVVGAVRGRTEKFHGHLVIDGRNLRWRDAPIEELHATLRLEENELQVAHFNLFNGGDYVRGRGVVNILGPTQYWGTLNASVADLGEYAALLQKPIVPEPLAGGALIQWSGEGSAKGHSGQFVARLEKLRSLGASAAARHPINAHLEGSYASGGMVFSKFALSDDDSAFTANVAVGNEALALQGIRFMHRQQLALEGDALLPLDVWKAWPNTSLDTLLSETVQSKVALTAYHLDLAAAAELSGWNFPIAGIVTGNFAAEGPLAALKLGGKLTIAEARLPLGMSDEVLSEVGGEASFEGATMTIARLAGRHPAGDFRASGTVEWKDVRDPGLQLAVESERSALTLFPGGGPSVEIPAELNVNVEGPLSGAVIRGTVAPVDARVVTARAPTSIIPFADPTLAAIAANALDASACWSGARGAEPPRIFQWTTAPWSTWRFDLTAQGGAPKERGSLASIDLHLGGTGAAPVLDGSISFRNVALSVDAMLLQDARGSLNWRNGEASIDLRASGKIHGIAFTANLIGPLSAPLRYVECDPPLSVSLVTDALAGRGNAPGRLDSAMRFALRVPSALTPDVEVFAWVVADPPAESTAQVPPPTAAP